MPIIQVGEQDWGCAAPIAIMEQGFQVMIMMDFMVAVGTEEVGLCHGAKFSQGSLYHCKF